MPVTLSSISNRLPISERGVSLLELKTLAAEYGLRGDGKRLTWETLKAFDGVAILFIRGNHFVLADPREKGAEGNSAAVRVYDNGPAKWWDQARLESV